MASAFGLWKARRLAKYGIEWERSLPREVWILTDCYTRRVYASKDEVSHWWNLIKNFEDTCDFLYQEKICSKRHTLVRGQDEIPNASFNEWLDQDLRKDPEGMALLKADFAVQQEAAVCDLPPFSLVPSLRPIPGVVYVLWAEDTHRIKIGRSASAKVRLETFQTASPFPLRLSRTIETRDTAALESALHRRYATYRRHGEWFELPPAAWHELMFKAFL